MLREVHDHTTWHNAVVLASMVPEANMTTTLHTAPDPEAAALNTIIPTLTGLSDDQRRNVLVYINARFGSGSAPHRGSKLRVEGAAAGGGASEAREFDDLGDLWDAANPQTEPDRVLVVAYWKQVVEGADAFESQPVNAELKHLGGGVSNITRALEALIQSSPKLALQVAKSGKSKQARKRYKLTREGIRRVQAMTNAIQSEGASNGN